MAEQVDRASGSRGGGLVLIFLAVMLGVLAWQCAGAFVDDDERMPGNPAVIERIAVEDDCDVLQAEFETAMDAFDRANAGSLRADRALVYAEAAEERRQQLGC